MAISYTAGKPQNAEFFVPEGKYRFRVVEAKEDTSKAGNEMITLKLRVILEDGSDGIAFYDRLVFIPSCIWKVDGFMMSCGKHPGEGQSLDLDPDDMIGWEGEAFLKVTVNDGKKKNEVVRYLFDEF